MAYALSFLLRACLNPTQNATVITSCYHPTADDQRAGQERIRVVVERMLDAIEAGVVVLAMASDVPRSTGSPARCTLFRAGACRITAN